MPADKDIKIFDARKIHKILEEVSGIDRRGVEDILSKARQKAGLTLREAALLLAAADGEETELILAAAGDVKRAVYGERLVLFAPLYLSNYCVNDCEYCGFHCRNPAGRKRLTTPEIRSEVKALMDMGHKRILLECGEDPARNTVDYVTGAISTIYSTKSGNGEIRRVNVNMAPPGAEGFRRLKEAGIGTYQLFQETYHRETYAAMHNGPKADFLRQLFAHDHAFGAGIDDVGLGVLFGLYDHRFDTLALISHARYLEERFGVGPHTVSVPRMRPAPTVTMKGVRPVADREFLRIIAVLRLAIPYTGIIISTRESPQIRSRAFAAGVTQASAASATAPGGYGNGGSVKGAQFSLNDHRTVERFLKDALGERLLPSFCTACYRRARTGGAFMELARPGKIQDLCRPNAILTFKEYLEDYATPDVREAGLPVIEMYTGKIKDPALKDETMRRLMRIEAGERDLFF